MRCRFAAQRHSSGFLLLGSMLITLGLSQDDAKVRADSRRQLADARKLMSSPKEEDQIAAVEVLAQMMDEENATDLLIAHLTNKSTDVRVAVARALSRHRRISAVNALARTLPSYFREERTAGAYVRALGDIKMCASLHHLLQIIELDKFSMANDALESITRIGCPECVQALVSLLRRAEREAAKPDQVDAAGPGGLLPPLSGRVFGRGVPDYSNSRTRNNPDKIKELARLVPYVQETLVKITGEEYKTAAQWRAAVDSGKLPPHLVSIYLCEKSKQTFEVPWGQQKKCPNADPKTPHNDVLLTHRRE